MDVEDWDVEGLAVDVRAAEEVNEKGWFVCPFVSEVATQVFPHTFHPKRGYLLKMMRSTSTNMSRRSAAVQRTGPLRSPRQSCKRTLSLVARNDAERTDVAETEETASTSASSSASPSRLQTPEKEDLIKGQGTAIVTGAISIIFGVAYLVLVSLLDVRGGELQPPPPEAFLN